MKWLIPAKTFLLGEYAAVAEASAIVLTTKPCFEVTLSQNPGLSGIHPHSPAGLWWQQQAHPDNGLSWYDPYAGQGGLGASSAQFLASYWASCALQHKKPNLEHMLEAYYQSSWSGTGLRPSGYDVIAQSLQGCVYINKQQQKIQTYEWPFQDLSLILIHTGSKLATHHHLQDTTLPPLIDDLSAVVDQAHQAFRESDSQRLIQCINTYHELLAIFNLVAEHSLKLIHLLKQIPEVLAIKGCGALGADILLLLCTRTLKEKLVAQLKNKNWTIIATENSLFTR